ncbi:MAG: pitrilysin family protein [Bacilli bacterium]|nr:pitrilysin family protein [Bacilli bacterium]
MKIDKIQINKNLILNLVHTQKFKTITLKILFKDKAIKKESTALSVLSSILNESSKKYPSVKRLSEKKEELYGTDVDTYVSNVGRINIFGIRANFVNTQYVQEDDSFFNKVFDFIHEIIYNPLVENNLFDEDTFLNVKNRKYYSLLSRKNDKEAYSLERALSYLKVSHPIKISVFGSLKDIKKLKNEDVYAQYKKVTSRPIEIYIVGDFNSKKIENLIKEHFYKENFKNSKKIFSDYQIPRLDYQEIQEKRAFNQTQLIQIIHFPITRDSNDFFAGILFNAIFGGTPLSKLFKNIREENSLCYSISSNYVASSGCIIVSSGIDYSNYEKTKELIKKQLNDIQEGKFTKEDLELNRKLYLSTIKGSFDSASNTIDFLSSNQNYKKTYSLEEYYENISKVNLEDVIRVAKKAYFMLEYCLKQGKVRD